MVFEKVMLLNSFQTLIEHEILHLFTNIPLHFQLDITCNISFLQETCTGNTLIFFTPIYNCMDGESIDNKNLHLK
jgi:hypothetical protein